MKHASARHVIERSFGLLKMRWAILRRASYYPVRTHTRIITACALLHNLIRREMSYDPLEAAVIQQEENQLPEVDEYIDTVESSPEWTNWHDQLAMNMYDDWMAHRGGH